MNNSFTAIDFETAQGKYWSICQVGLVRVENRIVTNTINRLVCPPHNFYFRKNVEIHGITPDMTYGEPVFADVWEEMRSFIEGQTVVAHNGAFDFSCLRHSLDYYGLPQPLYDKKCTYKIYRKNLATLCREYNIKLNHHDALSDAMACASLYQLYLDRQVNSKPISGI